ncbi:PREDICTED: uncharacterized protein LOC105558956 [Vollenhovia emeryi]|uniref:uncharacterized protein LOC105558956 n=1 Tax=Vollenhovia emeryi TaxID=411798 RepID=UPI0005F4B2CB|nr:PREDICTED: uncharacterized protein LOC105558956 [Vollenhovia emeryi]
MLRYLCIRLTKIEAIDACVSAHRKVFSYRILLVTRHVIKDKNGIWKRFARRKYRYFGCNDFEYTYTFSKRTPCGLSSRLISTFVLPQFDGPQIIPRIETGNMFPCRRTSFSDINLSSKLVTVIGGDCRTNRMLSPKK